jgi:hypothetical protein
MTWYLVKQRDNFTVIMLSLASKKQVTFRRVTLCAAESSVRVAVPPEDDDTSPCQLPSRSDVSMA